MADQSSRIWIITARVGAGHVQAARAISEALGNTPHETIDMMELVPRWFRGLYAGGYAKIVARAPALMGYIYDKTDQPGHLAAERARLAVEGRMLARLTRRL